MIPTEPYNHQPIIISESVSYGAQLPNYLATNPFESQEDAQSEATFSYRDDIQPDVQPPPRSPPPPPIYRSSGVLNHNTDPQDKKDALGSPIIQSQQPVATPPPPSRPIHRVSISTAMKMMADTFTSSNSAARQALYTRADQLAGAGPTVATTTAAAGQLPNQPPQNSMEGNSTSTAGGNQPRARRSAPRRIAKDIGMGVGILVAAPVVLAGAAVAATGGMIYGVGLILRGVGSAMACGQV